MNEMMTASQTCFNGTAQTQDCHQSAGITCCSIEVTALQNFLQVNPQQLIKILISAAAVASLAPFLLLVLLYQSNLLVIFQSWLTMLRRRILAFHHQIGSWLSLTEKRDPAHNFLWCGLKFAMTPIT
ncbi:MAG: hypothetical protein AAB729_00060 [Patescibacteria group bacterium]